jgi:hypothetical protein
VTYSRNHFLRKSGRDVLNIVMNRAKVKKLKSAGFDMTELNDMFNQMLGTSNINLEFAWPRFQRIRQHILDIVKILHGVANAKVVKAYFASAGNDLQTFCEAVIANIQDILSVTLDPAKITPSEHEAFSKMYYNMQRSKLIEYLVDTCKQLHQYEKHIFARDCAFIQKIPGLEWYPFPFSQINFKAIHGAPGVGEVTTAWMATVLYDTYYVVKQLCVELRTPNVDIDKFSEIIVSSLERIQKEPELSRCSTAFKKIRESVDLLKNNFGQYYSDFMNTTADGSAGNGFIIMEHFIVDVSKSTSSNVKLKREFAVIMKYFYKAFERQRAMNPQSASSDATSAFAQFNTIFSALKLDTDEQEEAIHIETVSEEDVPLSTEMVARNRAAAMTVEELAAEIEGKPAPLGKLTPKKKH